MRHRIGILSDTHITSCSEVFKRQVDLAFGSCDSIIHAGDITDLSVFEPFDTKALFAVHGNMCSAATRMAVPESRIVSLGGYSIAICHGAGYGQAIEERLFERFHDADCIVYGHTHHPVNHRTGGMLYLNPGSFMGAGRHGSPGTYAVLRIDDTGLSASLHELPVLA